MPSADSIETLNRVLAILQRSFPQYMRYARPYVPPGREWVMETVHEIAGGQDVLAERVSEAVIESGGLPDLGDFPIEFTDTHDLAIDFLVQEAIGCQKQDIASLEQCVEMLRTSQAAEHLAAEAFGMAKAHLELLEDLKGKAGQSTLVGDGAATFANNAPISKEAGGTPHRQEERKLLAGDPHSPAP